MALTCDDLIGAFASGGEIAHERTLYTVEEVLNHYGHYPYLQATLVRKDDPQRVRVALGFLCGPVLVSREVRRQ